MAPSTKPSRNGSNVTTPSDTSTPEKNGRVKHLKAVNQDEDSVVVSFDFVSSNLDGPIISANDSPLFYCTNVGGQLC